MHKWLPTLLALIGLLVLAFWLRLGPDEIISPRLPVAAPQSAAPTAGANSESAGECRLGPGVPSQLIGEWPGFRGVARDGIAHDAKAIGTTWPAVGPLRLWQIDVGEGYAGVAVHSGRVYLHDYDQAAQQDAIRCLSLDDGREIWRYVRPLVVKRNHGMSRTVPAVTADALVAMDPKCNVICLDPVTGAKRWQIDLVREYGAIVPPWYAGQCPLIDEGLAILAPCGPDLMIAVNLQDGTVVWRTPNTPAWKMTHASIVPMELDGRKTYVYCGNGGVVGIDAQTGGELWTTREWKISIATIASPVPIGGNRLFLSGGYEAGSMLLDIARAGEKYAAKPVFRLKADVFGATQQTPILFDNHLYGVRPDGELVCLALDGTVRWTSGPPQRFGLGPYLLADHHLFVLDDSCRLSLCAAAPDQFQLQAQAQLLDGHDAWGPMAYAGGRLLVRDLTHLICLQVAATD